MQGLVTKRILATAAVALIAMLAIASPSPADSSAISAHTDIDFEWAVSGISQDLDGVYGYSDGLVLADHGVRGETNSTATYEAGVYGRNEGAGPGVYGVGNAAGTGFGVRGSSPSAHAVYGDSDSTTYGHYGGWFSGNHGVFAQSESASTDALHAECLAGGNCWGADITGDDFGVRASTTDAANNYGVYTPDNIYSLNYHSVAGLSLIARYETTEAQLAAPLEKGDVVVVTGLGPALPESEVPTPVVRRAGALDASGIMGVVETAYVVELVKRPKVTFKKELLPSPEGGQPDEVWLPEVDEDHEVAFHQSVEGPVAPGGLMVVKVVGLAQVKAVATAAGIRPGEAIGFSTEMGLDVASAVLAEDGKVIGHALEALPPGAAGLVWALVGAK